MGFDAARRAGRGLIERAEEMVGGPARARVVAVLAATLGLPGADFATLSATADNLKQAFHVGNTGIGLLVSVTSLAAAAGTIPIGVLTDRTRRTQLLAISILGWSVAMIFAGAATSYLWLLLSRVALGVVTATTGPTIASLTGDFFPAASRARMLGYILGGELIGTGIGFVFSGEIAAAFGWRFAYWWLVIPSVVLFWVVWRLPEPARDGQSRLQSGQEEILDEREVDHTGSPPTDMSREATGPGRSAARLARRRHIEPQPDLVLTEDPTGRSLWWAVRYVLRVRTNVVIILASALGYFFFSGLRSFALLFTTSHYGISKAVASALTLVVGIGALAGVYLGGRIADRLLRRGWINARVLIPAVSLLAITLVFAPGVTTTSVAVALPLLTLGAALLGAANPPMDAARLDIIHPALWGRAEAIRTVLRTLGEAGAPVLFGLVSQSVFHGGKHGLEYTFLLFLITLIAAGLLALTAMRTYPRDVATAAASHRLSSPSPEPRHGDISGL
jgi:predicted MFS family arabinose efflux permease